MLTIDTISLTYDVGGTESAVLHEVSLSVNKGEFFTLLGPSGCGKTSTLRCVAGLESPHSGLITIGGEVVFSGAGGVRVPPDKRKLAMVFQSYAVWPHMTVAENVAFPLARQKVNRADRDRRVAEALSLVGLETFSERSATLLSGGQQQRVALARALVSSPRIILLDEPLSNLDAKLREQMRSEIRELLQKTAITTLFVTHDQAEALAMSDRIAVMSQGRIVEIGEPESLYLRPKKRFTADFLGRALILPVSSCSGQDDSLILATPIGAVAAARIANAPDKIAAIAIRPEHIRLDTTDSGKAGFRSTVTRTQFVGNSYQMDIDIGGFAATAHSENSVKFVAGQELVASFDEARVILLEE